MHLLERKYLYSLRNISEQKSSDTLSRAKGLVTNGDCHSVSIQKHTLHVTAYHLVLSQVNILNSRCFLPFSSQSQNLFLSAKKSNIQDKAV